MKQTRIAETKDHIFEIKVQRDVIPIGKYALHKDDSYRSAYPKSDHILVLCNESNQLSIEEHWREVVAHLPKVGTSIIHDIPLIK